jgi:hypothetical protein
MVFRPRRGRDAARREILSRINIDGAAAFGPGPVHPLLKTSSSARLTSIVGRPFTSRTVFRYASLRLGTLPSASFGQIVVPSPLSAVCIRRRCGGCWRASTNAGREGIVVASTPCHHPPVRSATLPTNATQSSVAINTHQSRAAKVRFSNTPLSASRCGIIALARTVLVPRVATADFPHSVFG